MWFRKFYVKLKHNFEMLIEGMKDEGICPGEKVILISIFVFVWFDKSITNVYFLLPPTYDMK